MSYVSSAYIPKIKRYYNVKPSAYYFYVKTKIIADFDFCISVPLIYMKLAKTLQNLSKIKTLGSYTKIAQFVFY